MKIKQNRARWSRKLQVPNAEKCKLQKICTHTSHTAIQHFVDLMCRKMQLSCRNAAFMSTRATHTRVADPKCRKMPSICRKFCWFRSQESLQIFPSSACWFQAFSQVGKNQLHFAFCVHFCNQNLQLYCVDLRIICQMQIILSKFHNSTFCFCLFFFFL